jgi:hypothetical protein
MDRKIPGREQHRSATARIEIRSANIMEVDRSWFYPMVVPVEMPVGLNHLDSDVCWCDPLVETDENGDELVLHRHVTWN